MTDVVAQRLGDEAVADAAARFTWDGNGLELGIGLALSGGGYRAMLFHAGALLRLNELGLLSRVQRVSSVSGGSITAGVLAEAWPRLSPPDEAGVLGGLREEVVERLLAFSRRWVDVPAGLQLLRMRSVAVAVADLYDRHLFRGATLQELPSAPAPQFVFCATNLRTGVLWRFTRDYAGDYVLGRIANPGTSLATAVAASSAFPPFLSPLKFKPETGSFQDWPSGPGPYLPDLDDQRREVVLTDGGAYDNHGLEPVVKRFMTVFASDGGAPFSRTAGVGKTWFGQLRRVLAVEDNQVRSLRRRDLIARFKAGKQAREQDRLTSTMVLPDARLGAYWGIATNPDRVSPAGSLPCDREVAARLAHVGTRLHPLGEDVSRQIVNWGYAVCDRCVREHYHGWLPLNPRPVVWPFPELPLGLP